MNIHAFICTRSKKLRSVTEDLVKWYTKAGINPCLIVGAKSIFSGYKKALDRTKPDPGDIIILCHDDIRIITDPEVFKSILIKKLNPVETGFLGVAGTTKLGHTGVWWDLNLWQDQKHSGYVMHGESLDNADPSFYGKYGQTVCMDGLFLAATAHTLNNVGLEKPEEFEGDWDFYDIHYTTKAHLMGLKNYTVPIMILHESIGMPREMWHKNRGAFLETHEGIFPIEVDDLKGAILK